MKRLVFLILFVIPSEAFSWGRIGHMVVGQIAEENLSKCAKPKISQILGKENIAEAAVWADWVKSDPSRDFQRPWHYINISDEVKFNGQKTNQNGDAVWAIKHSLSILKGEIKDKRLSEADALKLLIHIVGDIHQPLHVGRASDRGGGDVNVYFFDKITNLHVVWDTEILDYLRLSYSELSESLIRRMASGDWVEKPINSWVNEALELRKIVYTFSKTTNNTFELPGHKELRKMYSDIFSTRVRMNNKRTWKIPRVGYDYIYRALPVIENRLFKAGVRLSNMLSDLWCK